VVEAGETAEYGRPGRMPTHGTPESGALDQPVAHATQASAKRRPRWGSSLPGQKNGQGPDATV